MIKVAAPALKNPERRTLAEFHNYWAESHGPLFSNTKHLRRYVQHLTLPETYEGDPKPAYDGVSLFWFDDLETALKPPAHPYADRLRQMVREDDAQLFDRLPGWPAHHKRASVAAMEVVIKDGPITPTMVKSIAFASRLPGLTLDEFFDHWQNVHGPLAARIPQVRRYVQNHGIRDAYSKRDMTHDGWAEMWFDDLESMAQAHALPEWQTLREDGVGLFASPISGIVARERVQKEIGTEARRWGAAEMSEEVIREKLREQGYRQLADDPKAPGQIKAADENGALAVWTWEHIVTIDDSGIDARPAK
jgi:uncharacterized protein (TIGR02118 family)